MSSGKTDADSEDWVVVDAQCSGRDSALKAAYEKMESNPMQACQVCIGDKKVLFCLESKLGVSKEHIRPCADNLTGSCRTCLDRITKFANFIGSGGKHVAFCQAVVEANITEIRKLQAANSESSAVTDYELVVIDQDFVAKYPIEVGADKDGVPYSHVHFTCPELTPAGLAAKLKGLSTYLNGSFQNRFQRLVNDPSSLEVIRNEIPNLARPDHWRSVTSWAVDFVAKAGGRAWADLAVHEKFEIMVFAMLTGRSSGSVHLDMQQASNLVDFMDDAHNTAALRTMMDDRSNPETYQVSQVAELLRNNCVTASCTVTLMWGADGQLNASDLDLHTKVNGKELFYGTKRVGNCTLDFDANASRVEKNPAENISLNQAGTFVFRVNNYNNRDKKDVPFEVIVRKPGHHEVFKGVWPRARAQGNFMEVCTVVVTQEDLEEKPVELSEAEQKKLAAKEADWARMFGDVQSSVATHEDVEISLVNSCAQPAFSPPQRDAQVVFSQLLKQAPSKPGKPTLAQRCQLETLAGFTKYVTANKCSVKVDPRNFVPAYVTKLKTATDVLGSRYAINAYHRKNELPQQPRSDEQSTVRFDEAWGVSTRATVYGFVQINHLWFMVLEGAHLPKSATWPLGGGMYPTNLIPEAHHHRSKWASFHALVTPATAERGTPLIGSALVGFNSFAFILNGREINVRTS